MPPTDRTLRELQESIQDSKIARAAQLSEAEKLMLGAQLYDDGLRWLQQVILAEYPHWSEEEVHAEIRRRRLIARRIDDEGLFRAAGEISPND